MKGTLIDAHAYTAPHSTHLYRSRQLGGKLAGFRTLNWLCSIGKRTPFSVLQVPLIHVHIMAVRKTKTVEVSKKRNFVATSKL